MSTCVKDGIQSVKPCQPVTALELPFGFLFPFWDSNELQKHEGFFQNGRHPFHGWLVNSSNKPHLCTSDMNENRLIDSDKQPRTNQDTNDHENPKPMKNEGFTPQNMGL